MSSRCFLYIVGIIFFLGFFGAAIVAYDIIKTSVLDFCFSEECFKYAYKKFKTSFDILIGTGVLAAYISAFFGSYIALKNYKLSVEQDKNNRHLIHLSEFRVHVDIILKSNSFIDNDDFFLNKFYYCIFPDSRMAVFNVSDSYRDIIEKILKLVCESNESYGSGTGWKAANHIEKMTRHFESLGIHVNQNTPEMFFLLEGKIFLFLDQINTKILDFSYRVNDSNRYYSSAKS